MVWFLSAEDTSIPIGAPLRLFLAFLSLLAYYRPAQLQGKQESIGHMDVEGASRYSATQIIAASGLKIGQMADDASLDAVANHLSDTGAFSQVSYRYETVAGKMNLTIHVAEEPKFMTCDFDNFVWFSQEEIDRALQAEVPLYDGRVPIDGTLPKDVSAALEHLLAKHNIAATVSYIPHGQLGSAPTEYLYSAAGNVPLIASVDYLGGPLDASYFSVATSRLVGHPYSAKYAQSVAEKDLKVVYQNQGYLRANYTEPKPVFAAGANPGDPGAIKLSFTAVPGVQYNWAGGEWNGAAAYTPSDLTHFLGMNIGDIAAADKISAGQDAVREAYGKKGYVTAAVSSDMSTDDAAHKVRYEFKVTEGAQYHMGTLSVPGYDENTVNHIRNAWRLKPGDIYDTSYFKEFVAKALGPALVGTPLVGKRLRASFSTRLNASTQTVDVVFTLN